MARTLHADGNTGKVYIYNNDADPATYASPVGSQLGDLHFHSDLSYLGNAQVVEVTIEHPQRARSSSQSKGLLGSETVYNPRQGSETYTLAANSFGMNVPFVPFVGYSQAPAGMVVQQVGESVRAVSVYLTGTSVKLFEKWATFNDTLPAASKTYKIYLFQTLFTGSGVESIRIEPSVFKAGFGKLDIKYRYFRESIAPDFFVTDHPTADVQGGGLKVVLPDGTSPIESPTYTGSFSGAAGKGVRL